MRWAPALLYGFDSRSDDAADNLVRGNVRGHKARAGGAAGDWQRKERRNPGRQQRCGRIRRRRRRERRRHPPGAVYGIGAVGAPGAAPIAPSAGMAPNKEAAPRPEIESNSISPRHADTEMRSPMALIWRAANSSETRTKRPRKFPLPKTSGRARWSAAAASRARISRSGLVKEECNRISRFIASRSSAIH